MAVDDVEYMEPTPDSRRKFAACVLFGIVVAVAMEFFLLPAMRAARLDPVAALRHE